MKQKKTVGKDIDELNSRLYDELNLDEGDSFVACYCVRKPSDMIDSISQKAMTGSKHKDSLLSVMEKFETEGKFLLWDSFMSDDSGLSICYSSTSSKLQINVFDSEGKLSQKYNLSYPINGNEMLGGNHFHRLILENKFLKAISYILPSSFKSKVKKTLKKCRNKIKKYKNNPMYVNVESIE